MPINLEVIDTFHFHQAPVYALAIDQHHLYSAGGDRKIFRYEQRNGQFVAELFAETTESTFALHLNKNILFTGGIDGNLNIFDVQEKQILNRYQCHEMGLYAIESNDEFIITGGGDGKIHLWDKSKMCIVRTIWTGSAKIRKFIWDTHKTQMSSIDNEGNFRIFETKYWNEIYTSKHINGWTSGYYHDLKKVWILGSKSGEIAAYHQQSSKPILTIQAHLNTIYSLTWDEENKILVSGSLDKSIKIWDGKTLNLLNRLDKMNGIPLRSVNAIMKWNDHLAIAGDDKKIHITKICFFK
jgi:WD repeat-containing protein 61